MKGVSNMSKVIFTSLGPDRYYTAISKPEKYKDGDVVELSGADYEKAVIVSKFAQDYTPDLEERTLKLLKSAEIKRKQILEKVQKLKK